MLTFFREKVLPCTVCWNERMAPECTKPIYLDNKQKPFVPLKLIKVKFQISTANEILSVKNLVIQKWIINSSTN